MPVNYHIFHTKRLLGTLLLFLCSLSLSAGPRLVPDSLYRRLSEAQSPVALANAHLELSRAYLSGSSDSIIYHAGMALGIAKQNTPMLKQEGEALNLLAGVDHRHGDMAASMDKVLKALYYFEVIDDSLAMGRMSSNVAIIYLAQGDYEQALKYSNQGLEILTSLKDSSRIPSVLLLNARVLLAMDQPQKSLDRLKSAEKMFLDQNNRAELSEAYSILSIVYSYLGQREHSLMYGQLAMSMEDQEEPSMMGLLRANLAMGRHHVTFGAPTDALPFLNKAFDISISLEDLIYADEAQGLLKAAHKALGHFEMALYHDSIQDALSDSIFSLQKAINIASLQNEFDLEKQIIENQALKDQQENQTANLRNSKLLNSVMSWLLVLVITGGLGLWFIFRRVRNLNAIMKDQREEILTNNEQLQEMVEEINQQNDQIQQKNGKLESLNTYKDKLFSLISHDFRSPLASVLSLLKVIENGQMTMEESKMFAKQVGLRVQHTFQLVSNLLFWSKSQMKGINPNPQAFTVEEVLREVYGVYQPIAENKWVKLDIDFEGEHHVYADPDMIQTVLRNLVSNAIKYTPNQGSVSVRILEGAVGMTIAVQDTGLGMDEATKEKLFGDHVNSRLGTQNEKGTGIGLVLCKDFVDMNNGKIWVESSEGEGSTFYLRLPSAEMEDEQKPVENEDREPVLV